MVVVEERTCRRRGARQSASAGTARAVLGRRPDPPRTAAAVRRGEGLVQVRVDDVDAHVAGPGDADEGVEVRAVVVEERANVVEDLARSPRCARRTDPSVEEFVRTLSPAVALVDELAQEPRRRRSPRVGPQPSGACSRPSSPRGIRAVGRVRGDDRVRAARPRRGPRSTRASSISPVSSPWEPARLERARMEPRDLDQRLLEPPHELERPLDPSSSW